MNKLWKKIKYEIWWRRIWWFFYSRRTTWGVQWYEQGRWVINPLICDKVFFRKSSAEKKWAKIRDKVNGSQIAALWLIEKGNYKKVLESINY